MENRKLIEPGKWCTLFDENGEETLTVYDESFRKLLGYAPGEYSGDNKAWTENIHPEDAQRVAACFAECCAAHPEGMEYDIEYRMQTKRGYRWFHDYAHCSRREDGSLIRMDGAIFDIQEGFDKAEIIKHEKLRSDVFAYLNDHIGDPVELLKEFAPRVREILACDQVIYRDLEETRIMVNSPEIENMWSVPMEYCRQCEHFDAHHPMYKDGYTEMSNCQEGWQGIPVYKDCPIKSSLTRIVYCDDTVAGYLAIHYVQKYHAFTDIERATLEEFANILSMSLSRYEAKKRAGEVSSIKKSLSQNFVLSDQYDPVCVLDPVSGEYDWLMSVADDVAKNTNMSLHGDDFYKDIGTDAAGTVHMDDRERFRAVYNRANILRIAETGEAQEIESRWFIREEGQYRWKYNKLVRLFDDAGKAYIVLGVIDTTESRKKEEELQAQKLVMEEQHALAENSSRFFALEDNFISLYDVELESGHYTSFDRDEFYKRNVSDHVVSQTEFFKDLRTNVERVVFEEDREAVYNAQTRENIARELSEKDHIDHYYRIITENGPMWLKMRIVYKNAEKKSVIIGIFNAEEEMAARQKEEKFREELIQTNARLFALEDTFESLYDVELESGFYTSFVKGAFYQNTVIDKLVEPTDYFEDLRVNIDSVIYPGDREGLFRALSREYIRAQLAETEHYDYYYRLLNGNEPVWFKIRVVYKDAEKKNVIIGVFNAAGDVEARQIAEEKAKLEEEKKRIDIIHDIIHSGKWSFFVDADDRIVRSYYSEEVKRVINNDLSTGAQEWTDILHPDDKEEAWKAFTAAIADHSCNTPYDVTYRMIDRHGAYHWFHSAGRIVRDADGNGEFFGVHMNIDDQIEAQLTQQRQLEKNMQMIGGLASGYNALYYINIDENVLQIFALDEAKYPGSKAIFEGAETDFYKIIGGYGLSDQVHPDDRHLFEGFGPEWIREKLTGRKRYSMRFRAATQTGYRWDEMELTKYEDMGEQANAVAVGFADRDADIRKEQEYQQQLEHARVAADAANRSKSQFLFNMSHDIRTPMNAIRGFTTMAKKNVGNETRVTEYLNKIDISGQQLLTLINQVLEMARIESGKIELEEKPIHIREEFFSMVTVLDEQARSNGLTFTHSLEDIVHNDILADEARMSSVTLNIVGNAMKYTPSGGNVDFRLKEIPARKPGYGTYTFTVTDTGIGMSKEFVKKLYEPFAREKSSTVSKIQGTGLGLSIVKNIIDLMGGKIEVQSEPGKGTRFDITVDFRLNENAAHTAKEKETAEIVSFKGRRVLVVEDNEMNREIARDILEEQGLLVEDADDGDVAVAMVQAGSTAASSITTISSLWMCKCPE